MTTVVATRNSLHCDSLCTFGVPFNTTKIHRISHGTQDYLVGVCGNPHLAALVRNLLAEHGLFNLWKLHMDGSWPSSSVENGEPDLDAVVVYNGDIYLLDLTLVAIDVRDDEYVIGSGSDWYIAARDFGKPLDEALTYAILKDSMSGGPVQELFT